MRVSGRRDPAGGICRCRQLAYLPFIPLPNVDPAAGSLPTPAKRTGCGTTRSASASTSSTRRPATGRFYYHFDDSTVLNALPDRKRAGFSSVTPSRAQQFVMSNTKTFGPTAVNEVRVSFFRDSHRHQQADQAASQSFRILVLLRESGHLGINPSGPAGFPETVPPIYFNNFSIGVPTLTTFQPNNTWHVSDGFSKVTGSAHAQIRRRVPLPADQ